MAKRPTSGGIRILMAVGAAEVVWLDIEAAEWSCSCFTEEGIL